MPRRKASHYRVAVDRDATCVANGAFPTAFGREWTPEHLVLAALARCVLASLAYHARRDGLALAASADADGTVFQRPDGRWGFVEVACRIHAELDPAPGGDELRALLARAERGCFVGASLDPRPAYGWRVNGADVA
ncbi:MAG: OsmC family protein [Thermoleophilia bacterium]|nr:OsmC family protein [Thermoleophilia bacterium]